MQGVCIAEELLHLYVAGRPPVGLAEHLARLGRRPRGDDLLGHRPALDLIAVQQARAGPAGTDEGQLPAEVEGVLQAGVHPVTLGGRAHVGGVSGQQGPARSVAGGHTRVAMKASGVLHVDELAAGDIALQNRTRLGDEVAVVRLRTHVDAPAQPGQRGHDDRREVEEGGRHVEVPVPALDGGVEHRPGGGDVFPRKLDPAVAPHHAVEPVAPHEPVGAHFEHLSVALETGGDALLVLDEADQPRRMGDVATDRLEVRRQQPLGRLLREPEVESIAAARPFET